MMSGLKRFVLLAGLTAMAVAVLAAAPVTIRLATFAPANSAWHKALLDMGDAWTKSTQGRVTLKVYPSGEQGTEPAVVKLMRSDQVQAALLLQPGLAEIDGACNVMGMPFFLQSDEEMLRVFHKMMPEMAKRLDAKGFHVVQWNLAGWVQLFSKQPINTLAQLKAAKLYTTEGDDRQVQWYKSNGFHPVALNFNDIPAQLKLGTGMINAAPSPPLGANLLQFFRDAPYMLDLRVAPLIGATVINSKTWNAITPDDRVKIVAAAADMEKRMMADAPGVDAGAIKAMTDRGLKVTTPDAKALAEFRSAADQMVASWRGNQVPAEVFDMALQERDAYRKSKGK